jgi:hypothetical protein
MNQTLPIKYVKRTDEQYPYIETPQSWIFIVQEFIDSVDSLLCLYNLPIETVSYDQIKSKYNTLRIYLSIPQLLELDYSDSKYELYSSISNTVNFLAQSYEGRVGYLIKNGLLEREY